MHREWNGVRFAVPRSWTAYVVDNGCAGVGPGGASLTVTRRHLALEATVAEWNVLFTGHGGRLVSERSAGGSTPGLLRVISVGPGPDRIVTQLLIGGSQTVTATHAAPAAGFDRQEADAIIRSIGAVQPPPDR